jgi:hypothetical protein
MRRHTLVRFFPAGGAVRLNTSKPGGEDDDWTKDAKDNAKLPPEKGIIGYMQRQRDQAKQDNELTKKLGIRGAIDQNRQQQSESIQKAQQAKEAASRHMTIMKPGERLRTLATGRYDPGSHFLMLDLDFERDALIFGTTREEFYENVDKMKRVIIEYHRWERNDKFYTWGTRVAQVLTFFFLYDAWENERFKLLLASSLDNYKETHAEELEGVEQRRMQALQRALVELEVRPPNFDELRTERARLMQRSEAEEKDAFRAHPMDTLEQDRTKHEEAIAKHRALIEHAISPTSVPAVKNLRRVLLPQTNDWTVLVREEMLEYKEAKTRVMNIPDRDVETEPLGRRQQLVQPIFTASPREQPLPAAS